MAELVQSRLRESDAGHPAFSAPIVLDPRLLAGFAAPVPADAVDCITGIAIREAGFRELSVDTRSFREWTTLSEIDQNELATVHYALEDFYVAHRLRSVSPVLGDYLRARARVVAGPLLQMWREKTDALATRGSILESWLAVALYGETLPPGMDTGLPRAVEALMAVAGRYVAEVDAGVRLSLAAETWRWLRRYPRGVACLLATDIQQSGRGDEGGHDALDDRMRRNVLGGGESGSILDLSTCLVDAPREKRVERGESKEALPDGIELITADLRDLGVLAAETMVRDAEFDSEAYEKVGAEVTREITAVRRLFARLDEVEARWRYGLRNGKLDGRRLSRVASGKETVFKLRDRRHRSSMALIFLIDVSASMKSHISTVNRAACVVAEALRGLSPAVWHEVLTYTSGGLHPGAPVQLTRLAASGKPLSLNGVWSEGGTPTGEAIAAALLRLKGQTARRRLILHFTDGHPKNTYVVRQALELCRREQVDVVTVSVGTPQEALYGAGKCEVAYTVSELPDVLHRLLPRLYR